MFEVLKTIPDREREVLTMRFGLIDGPMTLGEIGKHYDLPKQRIRQIEVKALRRLRHPKRAKIIHELIE